MTSPDSQPALVFIVGLPRTGTKLIKIILHQARSSRFGISGETWFFGDLFRKGIRKKIRQFGDMSVDRNVRKLVDYFFSGKFKRSYWQLVVRPDSGFDREDMENRILQSDRSDKAIYVEIMSAFARRVPGWSDSPKRVMGDKTPGHLYYVPTILQWFPDAKIIHTFRDPRAIAASEWKKIVGDRTRGGLSLVVDAVRSLMVVMYVTITWSKARKLHYRYTKLYPDNYYLAKYEDLVADPEAGVKKLCDFVGVDVEQQMLAPRHADSSFSDEKEQKIKGIDATGSERWREHLKPWIRNWLSFWLGRYLKEFGYRL